MTENRLWQLRKAAKLTQRALAEKVGTSQQQIQRIEAGIIAVRLDLGARLADALGVGLGDVFPKLAKSKKSKKGRKDTTAETDQLLSEAGIDPDPRQWTIKFFMHDGREFFYRVASTEKDRLESIVSDFDKSFLVFNSQSKCVAINNKKIGACQFLYDLHFPDNPDEEEDKFELELQLISSKDPITFDLEPDTSKPEEDDVGLQSQLQLLFIYLDGADENEVVWFDDVDGERVYIRASEVLSIEVPLVCCEPALWKKSLEQCTEERNADENAANVGVDEKP